MFTSIGFHTFMIAKQLTQEKATELLNDFKKYRDRTDEIRIIKQDPYKNDRFGRHYSVVYPKQYKGISFRIRFSDRGFYNNGEFLTCSVKAIINPKIFVGEQNYIVSANASYLEQVAWLFDYETEKISPILRGFNLYSLSRIDYCINFDISELGLNVTPRQIMSLIKYADVTKHYHREYSSDEQFYLKTKSVVINCYWKHADLKNNFQDCPDFEKSYDIIRFEVQYKYSKVYASSVKIKEQIKRQKEKADAALKSMQHLNFFENDGKNNELQSEMFKIAIKNEKPEVLKAMLSDENCTFAIDDYFSDIVKPGDYYSFDVAKRIIGREVSGWEKSERLINTLQFVTECEGIANAKSKLEGKALENFRRSLRELAKLRINPVTIPKEWGISHIPNLLNSYYLKLETERIKAEDDKMMDDLVREYMLSEV